MDELKDIARLLKKKNFKGLKTFFDTSSNESKSLKLFKGIMEDRYQTDRQASVDIFDENPPKTRFRVLKSKVKEQMLDTVLMLDISFESSDRLKATYNCEKDLFLSKMFMKNGCYEIGYDILKNNIEIAKEYKMTDIVLSSLRFLADYYLLKGDEKSMQTTHEEISFFKKVYSAELLSMEYAYRINIKFVNSKTIKPYLVEEANEYVQEITQLMKTFKKYDSLTLQKNLFKLKSSVYEVGGDFKGAVNVYTQAENYFLKHKNIISPFLISSFSLNKLLCFVYLQDYKNGNFLAEQIATILDKRSVNYLFYLNHYFLLALQTGQLEQSLKILNKIETHKRFNALQFEKEIFILFKCYLIFSLLTDKNKKLVNEGNKLREKFKVETEIDKLKFLKLDKKGLNVAIHFVKLLFNLIDGSSKSGKSMEDELTNKIKNLKQYTFRYLVKNDYYRMDCFIKMLNIAYQNDFDVPKIKVKSQSYLKKLKEYRTTTSNSFYNWEIINYEILWEKILELLEK
ncbi:MAG: hypothetical protein DWQ06_13695 [Calditrichaeota bacterium]|nr:MAG: hypothetical protein DWQ06_13695 [Calditrichota bacterium]